MKDHHVKKMKRWATYWEEKPANGIFNKSLPSGIDGECVKLNSFLKIQLDDGEHEQTSSDDNMADEHMKRYSTSSVIRELQIKMPMNTMGHLPKLLNYSDNIKC